MILKASQRGGGQELAVHLMRMDDNEHVRLHELSGFASDTLKGAFKEAEAVSRGTKCRQYLFSLSLSPPEQERVPVSVFEDALDRIEGQLGLTGQPRAIVFHEKEGRRHAHCVWSRIDAQTMTARPLPFFKNKLMKVSRDLYLEHGWAMPDGIARAGNRNPTNFSLAEWQQAKRQGVDPRWIKEAVQACWAQSDNRASFERSLGERGFFLARGDRRGFVVLDYTGTVQALPRVLDLKTKDVRARLGDGDDLPSVAEVQTLIASRMTPSIRRHIADARDLFRVQAAKLDRRKDAMALLHREERAKLEERQSEEWRAETVARAARLPRGLRGLWQRITGQYQALRARNEVEARETRARHASECQGLIDQQQKQRGTLQTAIKQLRHGQTEQLVSLRRDVSRYLTFSRSFATASEGDMADDGHPPRDRKRTLSPNSDQGRTPWPSS